MSYQWQFNGTNIPGAAASSLTINVVPATVGSYSVIVSNDLGCLTSAPAIVQASSSAPPDSVVDGPIPAWALALIALGLSALGANALRSKNGILTRQIVACEKMVSIGYYRLL
jgi:hypothetical protein